MPFADVWSVTASVEFWLATTLRLTLILLTCTWVYHKYGSSLRAAQRHSLWTVGMALAVLIPVLQATGLGPRFQADLQPLLEPAGRLVEALARDRDDLPVPSGHLEADHASVPTPDHPERIDHTSVPTSDDPVGVDHSSVSVHVPAAETDHASTPEPGHAAGLEGASAAVPDYMAEPDHPSGMTSVHPGDSDVASDTGPPLLHQSTRFWQAALLTLWALVALLLIARLLRANIVLRRLAMSATSAGGQIATESRRTQRLFSIRRPVRCLVTDEPLTPMTWGLFRPIVLLPAEARNWTTAKLQQVLAHEYAHVARCDSAAQSLAQLARAFWWFHPLVWYGVRRMSIEREYACVFRPKVSSDSDRS